LVLQHVFQRQETFDMTEDPDIRPSKDQCDADVSLKQHNKALLKAFVTTGSRSVPLDENNDLAEFAAEADENKKLLNALQIIREFGLGISEGADDGVKGESQ